MKMKFCNSRCSVAHTSNARDIDGNPFDQPTYKKSQAQRFALKVLRECLRDARPDDGDFWITFGSASIHEPITPEKDAWTEPTVPLQGY